MSFQRRMKKMKKNLKVTYSMIPLNEMKNITKNSGKIFQNLLQQLNI